MKFSTCRILCIIILAALSFQTSAQKLVIQMNSGDENIENLNSIQKLHFSGNDLVVDFISGSDDIYAISDLQKLYFDSTVAIEDNPEDNNQIFSVYPIPAANFLIVKNIPAKAGKLSIYRMDGGLVLAREISTDFENIDISGLQPGLYLINVPGYTTKFIKK